MISTKKLLKTAAKATTVGYLTCSLVSNLVVNRDYKIPKWFGDAVSGTKMTQVRSQAKDNLEWLESYGYEKHTMVSDDGLKLVAYHAKPKEPSNVFVLCSHGYRNEGRSGFSRIARYYLEKGYNVFMVDHRASGQSEGKYIGFGYYESKDCLKWLAYLNENFGEDIDVILHGVSMGSATVMLMAGDENLPENVKMIIADCGYTCAWDEFTYKLKALHIPPQPLITFVNLINIANAGYNFKDTNALESVKKAKVPMLFVHGSADGFVPTYMVHELYEACGSENKDFMIVEGADHAASFVTDPEGYGKKIDEMVEKYMPASIGEK